MDNEEENNFDKDSSVFPGAIFMCNRTTMGECFERKIFGLPSRHATFVKKIKAGMVLFLFEHEERKLYGVFEATSDGALNIMPDAFTSSGKVYPAQILFKRIWVCEPLFEGEFRGAISENYYARYKFNFCLSYEQVSKLIQLFSSKKARPQLNQRSRRPCELVGQFELSYPDSDTEIENRRSIRFNSNEHTTSLASEDSRGSSQHYRSVSCRGILPDFVPSASQSDCSPRVHFPVTTSCVHGYCHTVQGHRAEFSSIPLGTGSHLFNQEFSSYPNSSIKTHVEGTRNQLTLQPDPKLLKLPMLHSQTHKLMISKGQEAKNGTSFPSYESARVGKPFLGSEAFAGLHGNGHVSFPDYGDPSGIKHVPVQEISARQSADSSLLMNSDNAHYYTCRAEKEDHFRKQYCMIESTSDYIPLAEDHMLVNSNSTSPNLLNNISDDLFYMQRSYSSDSDRYSGYDDLTPGYLMHDQHYEHISPAMNSMLHSDSEQRRISAFSRLSKISRTSQKVIRTPEAGLSPGQLLNVLSNRRGLWSETTKSTVKHRIMWNDRENFEIPLESVGVSLNGDMEGESAPTIQECSELPFLNFKRRRKVSKEEAGSEMHPNSESNKNEGSMKKRRRLVRPSFPGEEIQSPQVSSKELISGSGLVKDNEVKLNESKDSEPSTTRYEDIGNKNGSVSNFSRGSVATDTVEVNIEGLITCRNHISSGDTRTLLVESSADVSNAFTSDVGGLCEMVYGSQADSFGQSVLQDGNVLGNEECNKVETNVLSSVPLDAGRLMK